tara:strand:+ start:6408 stop:8513 length:2106 start_codon:yes stop_codon:yes gene_type:complete
MAVLKVPGDYSTIQAAVDAAVSGDVVFLTNDTTPQYIESVSVSGKTDLIIRGKNPGYNDSLHTVWYTTTDTRPLTIVNSSSIVIENLTVRSPIGFNQDGVRVTNSINIAFNNVHSMARGASGQRAGITIERTTTTDNVVVNNCKLQDNHSIFRNIGVLIEGAVTNVVVKNSLFAPALTGVLVQRTGAGSPKGTLIQNNAFYDCTNYGVYLEDVENDGSIVTKVENCTIDVCGQGVTIAGSISTHDVDIFDCNITNNTTGINNGSVGVTVSSFYNNVYNNGTDYTGAVGSSNDISSDPLYSDPNPGLGNDSDYRITTGSPCIDAGSNDALDKSFYDEGYIYSIANVIDEDTVDIGIHTASTSWVLGDDVHPEWEHAYLLSYQGSSVSNAGGFSVSDVGVDTGKLLIPVGRHPLLDPGHKQITNRRMGSVSTIEDSHTTYERESPFSTWTFDLTPKRLAVALRLLMQGGVSESASSPYAKTYTPYSDRDFVVWGTAGRYSNNLINSEANQKISGCGVSSVKIDLKEDAVASMTIALKGRQFHDALSDTPVFDIDDEQPLMWQDATATIDGIPFLCSRLSFVAKNNMRSRWYSSARAYRHDLGSLQVDGEFLFPVHTEYGEIFSSPVSQISDNSNHQLVIYWGAGTGESLNDVAFFIDVRFFKSPRRITDETYDQVGFAMRSSTGSVSLTGFKAIVADGVDRGF